jgi:hypothetical protein
MPVRPAGSGAAGRAGGRRAERALDTYTADVPELHHAAAETVSDLFLDAAENGPAEPPSDLP